MEPILKLSSTTFTHRRAAAPALRKIDLTVQAGESILLLGCTGAGKSTLGQVVTGLAPEFVRGGLEGRIELNGEDFTRRSSRDRTHLVGIVFQDFEPQLFSSSVLLEAAFYPESLGLPRDEIVRRVERWLGRFGLAGFERRAPYELSGGQQQRLVLASVASGQTPLMILDEAGTDLDPAARAELYQGDLMEEQARVVADCWAESPAAFDRVVVLDKGGIVAEGSPLDVLSDIGLLRKSGLRPPHLIELFDRLNLPDPTLDVDEAFNKLKSLVDRERLPEQSSVESYGSASSVLEIEGLSFSYPGGGCALAGVSADACEGEFIAVVGPNGGGKTTLLKLVRGLLKPSQGRVIWRGGEVQPRRLKRLAGEIGYVFQNPDHQLFAETVLDEVSMGVRWTGCSGSEVRSRTEEALHAVGLNGREEDDPFVLTRGDRQKLAVATVLALKPGLLLLDEPTTGLDYRELTGLLELCSQLVKQGHTILAATHNLDVLCRYASRVWVVNEGRIIFNCSPRALFEHPELINTAHLTEPEIVTLSKRLGLPTALTVDELLLLIRATNS